MDSIEILQNKINELEERRTKLMEQYNAVDLDKQAIMNVVNQLDIDKSALTDDLDILVKSRNTV
jgi:uncharacterized protein YigA (DUF484 family)